MPEFKLLLMDSLTSINCASLYPQKPVVLFYFSPHCPYCRAQTKVFIENIDRLKDIHLYFISNFPIPLLRSYGKEFGLSKYTNITLARDETNAITDYFEIPGIPYTAIYDKQKKFKVSFLGGKVYSRTILNNVEEK